MSLFIDEKYINLLALNLQGFEKKSDAHYNFRCPFCGDSKKDKTKKRGYVFPSLAGDALVFKCHNCGEATSLYGLLQKVNEPLAKEYLMETKLGKQGKKEKLLPANSTRKKPEPQTFDDKPKVLKCITELPDVHPAKEYIVERKIPKSRWSDIWYTDNFKAWVNGHYIPDKYKSTASLDPRIVFPVRLPTGQIYGFTGRSIYAQAKIRYYHISLDKSIPLMFGRELIDETKPVYVVEGNIDSMFLPNCIGAMSSNLLVAKPYYPDAIYIFDNEPRNKELNKVMRKVIMQNQKIVIWSGMNEDLKDLNDMVLAGLDVKKEVDKRVVSGLKAQIEWKKWRKVNV